MRATALAALLVACGAGATGPRPDPFHDALGRAERALRSGEAHCDERAAEAEQCRSYYRDLRFWGPALEGRRELAYRRCLEKFAHAPARERFFHPDDLPMVCSAASAHPREPVRVCVIAAVHSSVQPYDLPACVEDHRAAAGEHCAALEAGSPARAICLRAARRRGA